MSRFVVNDWLRGFVTFAVSPAWASKLSLANQQQFIQMGIVARATVSMKLDLDSLRQMHPLLPAATALEYAHRAAIGLQRHHHKPGVALAVELEGDHSQAELQWTACPLSDAEQLDHNRVTEDAAEAISLALVHEAKGWILRRRIQRGGVADFLLVDTNSAKVALEVSGMDQSDNGGRLRAKLEQASRATAAATKAACVVALAAPRATLATA